MKLIFCQDLCPRAVNSEDSQDTLLLLCAVTDVYKKALAEQDSVDVTYGRVMLLGSAGVGKTALKKSLMEEPWNPITESTIISDLSSVNTYRSIELELKTIGEKWKKATQENEIEELAILMNKRNQQSCNVTASDLYQVPAMVDPSLTEDDQVQKLKQNQISSIFEKAAIASRKIKENEVQPFLHIWDCGGQPVFLEILPAFLTSRTMFLLLFDASKNFDDKWQSIQNLNGQQSIEEELDETTANLMMNWMSTIHGHLAKHDSTGALPDFPQLICVGTHGDILITDDNKKGVKEKVQLHLDGKAFTELIQDILIVDNTTSGKGKDEDPNITKLRNAISFFVRENLVVKTPINWVLFRRVLQSLQKKVINLDEAQAIGVACNIPALDVPKVLMFYHEVGAVLFYPHLKRLQNKVILDPKWFVITLGKVFTLEGKEEGKTRLAWSLLLEKGILVQPLYVEVWKEYKNDIDPEDLMELLESLHLAAQVHTHEYAHNPNAKQYFLPAILKGYRGSFSEALPDHKQRASPLHITFTTNFVPPGFFTRLTTTMAEEFTFNLDFHFGIFRNRVTFRYGHIDCLILTDISYAIQVDLLRCGLESKGIPSFKSVCQDLIVVLEKCCKEVNACLYSHHKQIIDQSSYSIVVNHKFSYVCSGSCQSDDLHYLIAEKNQSCSYQFNCQKSRDFRYLTFQESLWFEEKVLECSSQVQSTTEISGATGQTLPDVPKDDNLSNEPSIQLAIQLLYPIAHQWDEFGVMLGVSEAKISEIQRDGVGNARKLNKLLNHWLNNEPSPKWQNIVDAVESQYIDNKTLGKVIRSKILK